MTLEEILRQLDSLKDFVNDSGKRELETIKNEITILVSKIQQPKPVEKSPEPPEPPPQEPEKKPAPVKPAKTIKKVRRQSKR
jgi:hypothetical protein